MPRINLTVQPELYDYILQHKPKSLSLPAFCSLLIEQQAAVGVDSANMLGGPSAAGTPLTIDSTNTSTSSNTCTSSLEELTTTSLKKTTRVRAREADPYKAKAISPDLVPADLLDCQQLLPEFWAVKKGTRSEGVWNRVCGKLRGWTPEQRREALERAIASGWGDVFEPPAARASSPQFGGVSAVPKTPQQLIVESVIRKHQEAEARRAAV